MANWYGKGKRGAVMGEGTTTVLLTPSILPFVLWVQLSSTAFI